MGTRGERVVFGIAVAAALALAAGSAFPKPPAKAGPRNAPAPAAKQPPKAAQPQALLNVYAAMPAAERLAIEADLAWVGDYDGPGGGDFDEHAIAAVKAFQKRNGGKETGILTPAERDQLAAAARSPAQDVGWQLIEDPATGAMLGLPEKLVPQAGLTANGSRWSSAQGQIRIETFRFAEAALPALFEDEKKAAHRELAASVLKADSFIISGTQGLKNFLVRVEASGSELRGVTVLYDQATNGIMDPVAVAEANAFVGFPDPLSEPPGVRRAVEYGTAIVVSSGGDLVASARTTDGCGSITVSGFGQAERIGVDKANDLALLRLYGARDLAAAALAGESGVAEVTLVGVADPLAEAGGTAVTSVAARLTAGGLEPVPKPGFSGAAAVDAQGRLVGMVHFAGSAVAGANSVAGEAAALVPVEIIRAFLQAHGISRGAADTAPAITQSVRRVICVRS